MAWLFASNGSRLQLALELVQEAPVSSVGDDPVGAGFDHASLVQAQRVEPHRVLGRKAKERIDLTVGEEFLGLGDELVTQLMSLLGSSST